MQLASKVRVLSACPECKNTPQPQHVPFGYCANCRAHTIIVSNHHAYTYEPVVVGEGRIFRCCTEPRNAWALLNPSPWADGHLMPCMYFGFKEDRGYAHGLVYSAGDGKWYGRRPVGAS